MLPSLSRTTRRPGQWRNLSIRFGFGQLGTHTHNSIIGVEGSTTVLASVAQEPSDSQFLTVEYRQKKASVGAFPQNRLRSEAGRPSVAELLGARAMDRALRPLLRPYNPDGTSSHYHIQVSLQAAVDSTSPGSLAVALNTASASLSRELTEPVAAVSLLVRDNQIVDSNATGELLFAGTRNHVVMMEYTGYTEPLPEEYWHDLLTAAQDRLQPILDTMDELRELREANRKASSGRNVLMSTEQVQQHRLDLGLESLDEDPEQENILTPLEQQDRREAVLQHIVPLLRTQLASPLGRLFGLSESGERHDRVTAAIHEDPTLVLSKSTRGQREQVMTDEIRRRLRVHLESKECPWWLPIGETAAEDANDEQYRLSADDEEWIAQKVIYQLLQSSLWHAARAGVRSDVRGKSIGHGWKTIRPLSMNLPALPQSVHGSSIFARGDTQVLCTVTLGAPNEGQTLTDPFDPVNSQSRSPSAEATENSPTDEYPVGSLRFLRTQEALESDMNSRKSKADKERTGESGTLSEVKRAFLQYDFPGYSTGEVARPRGIDRRAIGHGALAERAILPVLPDHEEFPYAIRMTSEVTDSNGSSSMATVCGAALALLDAGVPISSLVAGVSVGLGVRPDAADCEPDADAYSLLLDITGTEDHVSQGV